MKKFVIDANKNCKLSDFIYLNFPQISYHTLQKMLRKKDVIINHERVSKDVKLQKGDFVELYCPEREVKYFSVVYEDENIIVVNKAFGIIVSEKDKTRPNELSLQELVEKQVKKPLYSIHRIDMNTSGLVMFCKTKKVFDAMKNAMKNHEITKIYYAEVVGDYNLKAGEYKAYLEKNSKLHKVYVTKTPTSARSMEIKTFVKVHEKKQDSTVVRVEISNGKTHQIRAHLAFLGYPLVGDNKYGEKIKNKKFGTRKQKLLASEIIFNTTSKVLNYLNTKTIKISKNEQNIFFNK